jgi:hypothetical protein
VFKAWWIPGVIVLVLSLTLVFGIWIALGSQLSLHGSAAPGNAAPGNAAVQSSPTWATLASGLNMIIFSVGGISAVLALLFNAAPALLSKLGLGPTLRLTFLPHSEDDHVENVYVHPWSGYNSPCAVPQDGRFIRLRVENSGPIGAQNVECTVTELWKASERTVERVHFGSPKTLRWANSWEENFEALPFGSSPEERNPRVLRQKDFRHPTINPEATYFVDFGFVFPRNNKFYRELEKHNNESIEWALHLASGAIPDPRAVLRPSANGAAEYSLRLQLSTKNCHAVDFTVAVKLKEKATSAVAAKFDAGPVVSDQGDPLVHIVVEPGWKEPKRRMVVMASDAENMLPLEKDRLYYTRWWQEDSLVNHRITWLLQSQAFLFAAFGLLSSTATKDPNGKVYDMASVKNALTLIPIVGVILCIIVLLGIVAACGAQAQLHRQRSGRNSTSAELEFGVSLLTTIGGWLSGGLLPILFVCGWCWLASDEGPMRYLGWCLLVPVAYGAILYWRGRSQSGKTQGESPKGAVAAPLITGQVSDCGKDGSAATSG